MTNEQLRAKAIAAYKSMQGKTIVIEREHCRTAVVTMRFGRVGQKNFYVDGVRTGKREAMRCIASGYGEWRGIET